jgi:cytochrome c-type biogenesis protein CcmE
MKPRHRRLVLAVVALCGLTGAVALALSAFKENLVFFYTPSQVVAGEAPLTRSFRVGGLVERGSFQRDDSGVTAYFTITDTVHRVPVAYTGMLPDLFKEGRGSVAQGQLGADGVFRAQSVLAKHDETYMPAEAAMAIDDATRAR